MSKTINRRYNQIKSDILKCFQTKENWYRKELISECLKSFNLSESELKDNNSSSILIKSKSMIGSVISSMLNNNDLSIDNGKVITLGKEDIILIRNEQIEIFLKDIIFKNKEINKNELLDLSHSYFKTNETTSLEDNIALEKEFNEIIIYLEDTDFIRIINNRIYFNKEHPYQNTEIGNCLNKAYFSDNCFEHFIKAININGGEFLEHFAVSLLSKYFTNSKHILIKNEVTGGSNDGGLDGIIELNDELGYFERIYIQTKARNKVLVTVKELREFYGALMVEKGTRGIFVTNSYYHIAAKEFIAKTNNLIAIDGPKLYELAKLCEYGIIKHNNKLILDEKVFIER